MSTQNSEGLLKHNWRYAPAIDPNEQGQSSNDPYGDHFTPNVRYSGEVQKLRQVTDHESGKSRVELEARCLGGDGPIAQEHNGKVLKTTFWLHLDSELEAYDEETRRQKSFPDRLLNSFIVACGHQEQVGETTTPLEKMVGDRFEFITKDWQKPGVTKMGKDGKPITYAPRDVSQLNRVFKVEGTKPAENEPLEALRTGASRFTPESVAAYKKNPNAPLVSATETSLPEPEADFGDF